MLTVIGEQRGCNGAWRGDLKGVGKRRGEGVGSVTISLALSLGGRSDVCPI